MKRGRIKVKTATWNLPKCCPTASWPQFHHRGTPPANPELISWPFLFYLSQLNLRSPTSQACDDEDHNSNPRPPGRPHTPLGRLVKRRSVTQPPLTFTKSHQQGHSTLTASLLETRPRNLPPPRRARRPRVARYNLLRLPGHQALRLAGRDQQGLPQEVPFPAPGQGQAAARRRARRRRQGGGQEVQVRRQGSQAALPVRGQGRRQARLRPAGQAEHRGEHPPRPR